MRIGHRAHPRAGMGGPSQVSHGDYPCVRFFAFLIRTGKRSATQLVIGPLGSSNGQTRPAGRSAALSLAPGAQPLVGSLPSSKRPSWLLVDFRPPLFFPLEYLFSKFGVTHAILSQQRHHLRSILRDVDQPEGED